uniref:Putative ixodes 10 kDa peptide protein n=1 Tax=Ixodes ricinus TaxID=34613 RepID=A0A0K8RF78_IXORI
MKLVVFAVVLILSALLSADFSSGLISNCDGYIQQGGDLVCGKQGSNYYDFDPNTCTVRCTDGREVNLPPEVCSPGEMNCTSEVETKIGNWVLRIQEEYI